MKKTALVVLIIILSIACKNTNENMKGTWVISQAYYHDTPVIWDLYGNAFSLDDNNICELPTGAYADGQKDMDKGKWYIIKDENKTSLQINTKNFLFNRTFEIKNLRKEIDEVSYGSQLRMTLVADSLKLDCVKSIYK